VAGFKVILDDLGIETASASCYYSNITFSDTKGKFRKYGAIGVTTISVDSTTSGTLKGAAWGMILAGPIGLAVGSMVGGGMKVAFELHTLEGETLKGIATKGSYLDIKKQVETRPAKLKPPKKVRLQGEKPRVVSLSLFIGIAVLPFIFVWLLFRCGYSARSRFLGLLWFFVWFLGISNLPASPSDDVAGVQSRSEVVAPDNHTTSLEDSDP